MITFNMAGLGIFHQLGKCKQINSPHGEGGGRFKGGGTRSGGVKLMLYSTQLKLKLKF